eukprot:1161116-Pelagomonas_calceolata.AAC.4
MQGVRPWEGEYNDKRKKGLTKSAEHLHLSCHGPQVSAEASAQAHWRVIELALGELKVALARFKLRAPRGKAPSIASLHWPYQRALKPEPDQEEPRRCIFVATGLALSTPLVVFLAAAALFLITVAAATAAAAAAAILVAATAALFITLAVADGTAAKYITLTATLFPTALTLGALLQPHGLAGNLPVPPLQPELCSMRAAVLLLLRL